MVLGRVPFQFDSIAELIAAHLATEPDAPRSVQPGIPAALDALLLAMLAKDPAKRPSIGHVQDAIARLHRDATSVGRTRAISSVSAVVTPPVRDWRPFAIDAFAYALIVALIVLAQAGRGAEARGVTAAPLAIIDAGIAPAPIPAPAIVVEPLPVAVDAGVADARPVHVTAVPIPADAAVTIAIDAAVVAPPPEHRAPSSVAAPPPAPKPPLGDRNQTVNPFKKHSP
jgi:serine/threonine-protein kinase